MDMRHFDLCVIGGGINGAGVARDAAMRGLSVILVDAGDLAGMTSSASSKMLHGGLRYLEHYEFSLVKEALHERETILRLAPHISHPMDFILPHTAAQRSSFVIRAGLFFYDRLAGRHKLKSSKKLNLQAESAQAYASVLNGTFKTAFRYTDGQVDDARLVVLNAVAAGEEGAEIATYTACKSVEVQDEGWRISLRDLLGDRDYGVTASMVVNAAGPMANDVLQICDGGRPLETAKKKKAAPGLKLVKGSHIVVKRLYDGDHGYLFQHSDGRVIFMWPYEGDYTLIGTTEEVFEGDARQAEPSEAEISYLCRVVGEYCSVSLSPQDVVAKFSGVRPLVDEGKKSASATSRRHMFHEYTGDNGARIVSIYGGKLTTYRLIAQEVVDLLVGAVDDRSAHWPLPGGDVPGDDLQAFIEDKKRVYQWLDDAVLARFIRQYGTRIDEVLEGAVSEVDMGDHYGDGLYEREVRYLVRNEFARTSRDILWRRTKLDLFVSEQTRQNLEKALPVLLHEGENRS